MQKSHGAKYTMSSIKIRIKQPIHNVNEGADVIMETLLSQTHMINQLTAESRALDLRQNAEIMAENQNT